MKTRPVNGIPFCANMAMRTYNQCEILISEWNHRVTIAHMEALALGCKPKIFSRRLIFCFFFGHHHHHAHLNVLFCTLLLRRRDEWAAWHTNLRQIVCFCLLPTLVSSSTHHHQNRRNHHTMVEKNRNQKSRSMYEYEIIIILSTLHNPSEFAFCVFIAEFFSLPLCAREAFFPGWSFLRWWWLQAILNPSFAGSRDSNAVWY